MMNFLLKLLSLDSARELLLMNAGAIAVAGALPPVPVVTAERPADNPAQA